jgi:hypothetical protein
MRERVSVFTPTWPELVRETIASMLASIMLTRGPALFDAAKSVVTGSAGEIDWVGLLPRSRDALLLTCLVAVLLLAIFRAVNVGNKRVQASVSARDDAIIGGLIGMERRDASNAQPERTKDFVESSQPAIEASVDDDESDEEDEGEDNADAPLRSGFVKRFGMLWHVHHVPKALSNMFGALRGTGFDMALRIDGPYCPKDYVTLQCKERQGYRYMSDGDDVNLVGSAYCPTCGYICRPDPNYQGPRLLGAYRQMVKEEFER